VGMRICRPGRRRRLLLWLPRGGRQRHERGVALLEVRSHVRVAEVRPFSPSTNDFSFAFNLALQNRCWHLAALPRAAHPTANARTRRRGQFHDGALSPAIATLTVDARSLPAVDTARSRIALLAHGPLAASAPALS
jgi:hypothetical protein